MHRSSEPRGVPSHDHTSDGYYKPLLAIAPFNCDLRTGRCLLLVWRATDNAVGPYAINK
jgi:hypothetical protein